MLGGRWSQKCIFRLLLALLNDYFSNSVKGTSISKHLTALGLENAPGAVKPPIPWMEIHGLQAFPVNGLLRSIRFAVTISPSFNNSRYIYRTVSTKRVFCMNIGFFIWPNGSPWLTHDFLRFGFVTSNFL